MISISWIWIPDMLKIVTYNVNGIRQRIAQYGSLLKLLDSLDADIICFQVCPLIIILYWFCELFFFGLCHWVYWWTTYIILFNFLRYHKRQCDKVRGFNFQVEYLAYKEGCFRSHVWLKWLCCKRGVIEYIKIYEAWTIHNPKWHRNVPTKRGQWDQMFAAYYETMYWVNCLVILALNFRR